MKNYKLPKEFAEKWIAALRSGEYEQGGANLLSYEKLDDTTVDFNKKSYCCLGVACALTGVQESIYSRKSFVDEDSNIDVRYMLEIGYPKELVGEKNLPYILSMLNDGVEGNELNFKMYFGELNLRKPYTMNEIYKLNFSEIADFIEDNVEFY